MPIINTTRKKIKTVTERRQAFVLPGITAVVIIPHKLRRATGGLVRQKDGPEITIRVNDYDTSMIREGAQMCGLKVADYVRQCAVNMTLAMKGQTDAPYFTAPSTPPVQADE